MIASIHEEARAGAPVREIALRFHNTMAEWIVAVARAAGLEHVVLSGGVFQNGYLTERTRQRLCEEGFRTYTHQRVPPNDGGICLGQAILASLPGAGSGFDETGGAAGDSERASPGPGPSR
jgi:hydrogenase maturation protein HypF